MPKVTELRNHPGVHGKRDAYPFDPRMLKIDDQYNVRDLSTPEAIEKLAELKESIRANGVKVPLEIRFTGGDVYIVSGHRRHRAVMELIEEGEPIETVLVISEPKGTSEPDRVLNLVTSNSGEPLKPLEVAEVVRRLRAFGWEHQQIARRMGWKSISSVNQYLDMLAMPEGVKDHVRKGDLSATLAKQISKNCDPQSAEELIRANLEENKRIKGKRTKITPKQIKRSQAKATQQQSSTEAPSAANALPAEQQPAASLELPPASVPMATRDGVEGEIGLQCPGAVGVLAEHPDADLHQATLAKVEEHNGWHPDQDEQAAARQENFVAAHALTDSADARTIVKYLIDALEPFAAAVELNNLGERPDDDVIEIPIRDLKRAWRAYTQATGAQS